MALEDPLRGSPTPAGSELALAHLRQFVGEEPRAPYEVGPDQVVATQEEASARGDTGREALTAEIEVLSLKPDKPVCQLRATITNQDGIAVLEGECWTYTLLAE
jgi:hypothetical protein